MKRNLKALGLVLASVFALSAIGATAASAAEFHAASAGLGINGVKTTNHVFSTDAGTVECSTVTFSGTASAKTQSEITLTPKYESCEAFFFVNVPIHVNGCGYKFQASGTTEVECPAGKSIEITAPGCTTTVGPQHFSSGMSYTNNAGKTDVIATTNISGIKYNECGSATSNGTYTGKTTVTGAGGASVWYE